MHRLFIGFVLFATFVCSATVHANDGRLPSDMLLMSEQFPPYNYQSDGEALGISVELMDRMLQDLGSGLGKENFVFLPWARSYNRLQHQKDTVLFVMTRTKERESLFKWVGPVTVAKNVLFAAKSRLNGSIEARDIRNYRVGAVRDDAGAQLTASLGGIAMEDMEILNTIENGIKMMNLGRIDLLAYDENVLKWVMKDMNIDTARYHSVFTLEEGRHYFAFNKDTDDNVIDRFQEALDDLNVSGEFDAIMKRYLE